MHPADQIPGRLPRLEKLLQRSFAACQFLVQRGVDLVLKSGQQLRCQILRARHGRRIGNQRVEIIAARRNVPDLAALRRGAQGGDIACGQIAPPGPGRRQKCGRFPSLPSAASQGRRPVQKPGPAAGALLRRAGASSCGRATRWPRDVSCGVKLSGAFNVPMSSRFSGIREAQALAIFARMHDPAHQFLIDLGFLFFLGRHGGRSV